MPFRFLGFGVMASLLFAFVVAVHDLAGLWTLIRGSPDGAAILALLLVSLVFLFGALGAFIAFLSGDGLRF